MFGPSEQGRIVRRENRACESPAQLQYKDVSILNLPGVAWADAKLCNRLRISGLGWLPEQTGDGGAVASGLSSSTANHPAFFAGVIGSAYRSLCGRYYVAPSLKERYPAPLGLSCAGPAKRVHALLLCYRIYSFLSSLPLAL